MLPSLKVQPGSFLFQKLQGCLSKVIHAKAWDFFCNNSNISFVSLFYNNEHSKKTLKRRSILPRDKPRPLDACGMPNATPLPKHVPAPVLPTVHCCSPAFSSLYNSYSSLSPSLLFSIQAVLRTSSVDKEAGRNRCLCQFPA